MTVVDADRWRRLSPRLDELLELDPARRAERLEALRADDRTLADELAALIDAGARADAVHFLAEAAAPVGAAFAPATLAGLRLGAYLLEAPIGQGGGGAVWRARRADGRFEGSVAVKLLHPSLIGRTGARRFEREGAILARLSHPHIAHLLDAGVTPGGQPYLVIELVEGERIDRHCDARRLRVEQRIALFRDVLGAVAHAHRHLVIHRDIKPGNILVAADGSVKLLDFGIAKLLQGDDEAPPTELTGARGGALTPEYAAPEQLRGEEVTTATDVYSLGVLLYQLLSGQHPTAPLHATAVDLMRATLDSHPERLSNAATRSRSDPETSSRVAAERATSAVRLRRQLGGDLENIVGKALRKAPAERYATVDAFDDDLRRWSVGEPVRARPDSLAYRASRFIRRHRGAVAAGALTLAAIVVGLIGTISQAHRAEVESEHARREAEAARLERDVALRQQLLQRGTSEFLQLLMRDAAGGDPGSIRKQLDRAVVLIENTGFEQPIVKVGLLRQTAGRYGELGDWDRGVTLMREAIAATVGTDLAAPGSGVPVNLACSLARFLQETADLRGARAELDRADRLLAAGASVSLPSEAECRVQRSYLASEEGEYRAGIAILRDVLARLAAAGVRDGEQPRVVRSALSRALLAAGEHAAAMAVAAPLLAESVAGQGSESMAVLRRSSVVTSLTRLGGDPLAALALSEADRATAARLLGGRRIDASIELEHGRILRELGRFDDAAAALARSAAAAGSSPRGGLALWARLGEAEALLGGGRLREASARMAALAGLRASATAPVQIDALRIAGSLAAAAGERASAERDFEAAAQRIAAGAAAAGGASPQQFALALARGELAVASAGTALARADEALAAARARALDAAHSSDVGRALLLRARALALAGRDAESRHDAAAARAMLEPTLGATHAATRAAAVLATSFAPRSSAPLR